MKKIIIVLLFLICSIIFIPIVINKPIATNSLNFSFDVIWFLIAIILGGFAAFFPKKFNAGNAKAFDKLNEKTNINLLKKMSEETLKLSNNLNIQLVGILFLIIGFIGLFKYLFK